MYVYEGFSINYWNGMYRLNSFIKECIAESKKPNNTLYNKFYLDGDKVRTFLIECFVALDLIGNWDGDILDANNIAISALPIPNLSPYLMLALKQTNEEKSFIVTQVELGYLKKFYNLDPISTKNVSYPISGLLQSHKAANKIVDKIYLDCFEEGKEIIIENKELILEILNNNPEIKNALTGESKKDYLNDFVKIG